MKTYVIYRDRSLKHITRYSAYPSDKEGLFENVEKYNKNQNEFSAEIATDKDLICLIQLAEENKKLKDWDISRIEGLMNDIQNEFYHLKESIK